MTGITASDIFLRIEAGSHGAPIDNLAITSDGRRVITGGKDKSIRIWDVSRRSLERTILWQIGPGRIGELSRMVIHPDDRRLFITSRHAEREETGGQTGCTLRVFDLDSGNLLISHAGLGWISAMRFVADGAGLLTIDDQSRTIRLFDAQTLTESPNPKPNFASEALHGLPNRIDTWMSETGMRLLVAAGDPGGGLTLFDLSTESMTKVKSIGLDSRGPVAQIAVGDSRIAVTYVNSQDLSFYDLELNPLGPAMTLPDMPGSLAFSPDATLLVGTASEDAGATVKVFDVSEAPKLLCAYAGHAGYARQATFLPDGSVVSVGGTANEIHFWTPADAAGKLIGAIRGNGRTIHGVGLSADQRVGLGFSARHAEDANDDAPLDTVLDLRAISVAPFKEDETPLFARPVVSQSGRTLEMPPGRGHNLYLKESNEPLTGTSREPWYYAETFGFTPRGSIITGDRNGEVRRIGMRAGRPTLPGRLLRGHQAQVRDHAAQGDWLVTGGQDQIARLWFLPDVEADSNADLRPALNMFVAANGEWVVWSESNFFDASERGDCYMGFHVNQGDSQEAQFLLADRFVALLYRPGVIRAILETGSEARALKALGLELPDLAANLPPVIECHDPTVIRTGGRQVDLTVEVRPGGAHPIKRVWVLRNDHIVMDDRNSSPGTRKYEPLRLELIPGENRIKILAEGDCAKSNPVCITVNPADGSVSEYTSNLTAGDAQIAYGAVAGAMAASPSFAAPESAQRPPQNVLTPLSFTDGPPEPSPIRPRRMTIEFDLPAAADRNIPIKVTRNGKPVYGAVARKKRTAMVTIPVPNGEYEISIHAGDRDAQRLVFSSQSRTGVTAELAVDPPTLTPAPPPVAPPPAGLSPAVLSAGVPLSAVTPGNPDLYILSIGVSTLKNPTPEYPNLKYATADAIAVRQALETQKGVVFDDVRVWELLDAAATLEGIRAALSALDEAVRARGQRKRPDGTPIRDVTVIFLAGHGVQTSDGKFFFWNHDFDLANRDATGLSFLELGDRVTAFPTELFILIDACHSSLAGAAALSGLRPDELFKRLSALNERAQTIFSATQKGELAMEDASLGHGLFTKGILKTLATATPGVDVSVLLLMDTTMKKVLEWSSNKQKPSYRVYGDESRWIVYRR